MLSVFVLIIALRLTERNYQVGPVVIEDGEGEDGVARAFAGDALEACRDEESRLVAGDLFPT